MVGRICPPGRDRVKVSENLGATSVAPVASVDTPVYTCIFDVALKRRHEWRSNNLRVPEGHTIRMSLNSMRAKN